MAAKSDIRMVVQLVEDSVVMMAKVKVDWMVVWREFLLAAMMALTMAAMRVVLRVE